MTDRRPIAAFSPLNAPHKGEGDSGMTGFTEVHKAGDGAVTVKQVSLSVCGKGPGVEAVVPFALAACDLAMSKETGMS